MRVGLLFLLAIGCAHRPVDAAPTSPAAEQPASAQEPSANAGDPMTASEAETAARDQGGSAGDGAGTDEETRGCSTDADCSMTRVEAGGCCPMLCSPRVVTRKRAEALEADVAACNKGRQCVVPLCRPPKEIIIPACEQDRCVAKSGGPAS